MRQAISSSRIVGDLDIIDSLKIIINLITKEVLIVNIVNHKKDIK